MSHPIKTRYRRKGLPRRLKRIPGGVPGLVAACNVIFQENMPAAKVAIFRNRTAMRRFYEKTLCRYRGAEGIPMEKLGRRCAGFVNKLEIRWMRLKDSEVVHEIVELDRRYFCIVCLVEGDLTAEVLAHEAVHVGFAWDFWTRGQSAFTDPHNHEENVCYPAGIFLDQVLTFIKSEGLREI